MKDFNESRWADKEFSRIYRDAADIYMPFRRKFVEVAISLYSFFHSCQKDTRVLDLGCGDGFFAEALLEFFPGVEVTLLDGSDDMIDASKKRLSGRPNIDYVKADFQTVICSGIPKGPYNFIYSSYAIHHLHFKDKERLYGRIHDLLMPGGCFAHNDVIRPISNRVEDWYLSLWREWIDQFPDKQKSAGMEVIPEKYRESPDDFPDSLEAHIELLKYTGFIDVDCYFKYGIFALFGGFKTGS